MRDISIIELGIYLLGMTVLGRFILALPTLPPAQMDDKTLSLRSLLYNAGELDESSSVCIPQKYVKRRTTSAAQSIAPCGAVLDFRRKSTLK